MADQEQPPAEDQVADRPRAAQLRGRRHLEVRPPDPSELPVSGEVRDHDEQRDEQRHEEGPERRAGCRGSGSSLPTSAEHGVGRGTPNDDQDVEMLQQHHGGSREARGRVPPDPPAGAWLGLVDKPPSEEEGEGDQDLDLGQIEQPRVEVIDDDGEDGHQGRAPASREVGPKRDEREDGEGEPVGRVRTGGYRSR